MAEARPKPVDNDYQEQLEALSERLAALRDSL